MKEINFLPERYHDEAIKRQGKLWHLAVIVLFGSIISATALFQFAARRRVDTQLAQLAPQYSAAEQTTAELARLQKELDDVGVTAQLFVYLEGRWPTTQILSSAVAGLPDSVRWTSMQLSHQKVENAASGPGGRAGLPRLQGGRHAEETGPQLEGARRDLKELRTASQEQQTVIILEGETEDASELYLYASQLAFQPLLAKAEIVSLEGKQQGDATVSTFRLRLIAEPAYGQPAGPSGPPEPGRFTFLPPESTP